MPKVFAYGNLSDGTIDVLLFHSSKGLQSKQGFEVLFTQVFKRYFPLLAYMANPIVPNDNPATEAPHEKKFKKKVDSKMWMTIKKGRITPRSIRITPRLRRKRGFVSMLFSRGKTRLCVQIRLNRAILIQPARHEMFGLRFEVWGKFNVT
jgi:hypothetical protein